MHVENTSTHTNSQANTIRDVRFRCPHCQKLYRTSEDVFQTMGEGESEPEFDCLDCKKSFKLLRNQDSFGLYKTSAEMRTEFSSCPKCNSLKQKNQDECPSCGVFESKYLEIQKLESPELYELNQIWQKLLKSFEVDYLHQDFINKCQQKMALNFAFQRYMELRKTLGYDSWCERYIRQIELRLEQQVQSKQVESESSPLQKIYKSFSLAHWGLLTVGALALSLLLFNKFFPTFPNLNGLLILVTVLSFGFVLLTNNQDKISL